MDESNDAKPSWRERSLKAQVNGSCPLFYIVSLRYDRTERTTLEARNSFVLLSYFPLGYFPKCYWLVPVFSRALVFYSKGISLIYFECLASISISLACIIDIQSHRYIKLMYICLHCRSGCNQSPLD